MKNFMIVSISIIFTCFFTDSSKLKAQQLIEFGSATFRGKIHGTIPEDEKSGYLSVTVANCCTSERMEYSIPINDDGSFSYNLPVSYATFGGIESGCYYGTIYLAPNKETTLNIYYDKEGKKHTEITGEGEYTTDDMMNMLPLMVKILRNNKFYIEGPIVSPQVFREKVMRRIDEFNRLFIDSDPILSTKAKFVIKNELGLFFLTNVLFDYAGVMESEYRRQKHEEDENIKYSDIEAPNIEGPDRLYYTFLKDFNLNSPEYITCSYYPFVLQTILNNKTFNIGKIEDANPQQWVTGVKDKLKDLVGFDSGLFYDLLVSGAYSVQLNEMRPFTKGQIEDIKSFFANKAISEILIAENSKILNLLAEGKTDNNRTIIKEIKEEEKGKIKKARVPNTVIKDIIAKHKGKAILVDFWATWCGPCTKAIREIEPLKKEYENKDIVFVYITDESSPQKAWEIMKTNIPGDHYYVTEKVWDQLTGEFGFGSIPTYLFYDKKGNFHHKNTPFPGKEEMWKMIEELLQ